MGHSADEDSFTFSTEDACNLRHHIAETLARTARRANLDFTPGDVEVVEAGSPKGISQSTVKSPPSPDSLDDGAETCVHPASAGHTASDNAVSVSITLCNFRSLPNAPGHRPRTLS